MDLLIASFNDVEFLKPSQEINISTAIHTHNLSLASWPENMSLSFFWNVPLYGQEAEPTRSIIDSSAELATIQSPNQFTISLSNNFGEPPDTTTSLSILLVLDDGLLGSVVIDEELHIPKGLTLGTFNFTLDMEVVQRVATYQWRIKDVASGLPLQNSPLNMEVTGWPTGKRVVSLAS